MPDQSASSGASPLICVDALTKFFLRGERKIEVLRGIDLRVAPGEILSIVGRSGAGKSTLLHILGTIDTPSSGRIDIAGQDLAVMSPRELAAFRNRMVGFIFQFHHLLPDFDALENVMLPALIAGLSRREAGARAKELLDAVGLSARSGHLPGELSGGEQQRVALARALVLSPRLLLADEPTGNLDSKTGAEIHELFLSINQRHGTTMVIVTHNPDLARRAPRTLAMADGRLCDGMDAAQDVTG